MGYIVQSIVFDKDKGWNSKTARNWIKDHKEFSEPIKVDETVNTFRFRLIPPKKAEQMGFTDYRMKTLASGDVGISLDIAYNKLKGKGTGGSLANEDLEGLLAKSYEKDPSDYKDFQVDKSLSGQRVQVYHNPTTQQTIVSHRGTTSVPNWIENVSYAVGNSKSGKAFQHSKKIQDQAYAKYGKENITTIGHSKGALHAQEYGKKGKEVITLNKPVNVHDALFTRVPKSQTDIRTQYDPVSFLRPFQKGSKVTTIKSTTKNPLKEHQTSVLGRLDPRRLFGGALVEYSDEYRDQFRQIVMRRDQMTADQFIEALEDLGELVRNARIEFENQLGGVVTGNNPDLLLIDELVAEIQSLEGVEFDIDAQIPDGAGRLTGGAMNIATTAEQLYEVYKQLVNTWNTTLSIGAVTNRYNAIFPNGEPDGGYFLDEETNDLSNEMSLFVASLVHLQGMGTPFEIPDDIGDYEEFIAETGEDIEDAMIYADEVFTGMTDTEDDMDTDGAGRQDEARERSRMAGEDRPALERRQMAGEDSTGLERARIVPRTVAIALTEDEMIELENQLATDEAEVRNIPTENLLQYIQALQAEQERRRRTGRGMNGNGQTISRRRRRRQVLPATDEEGKLDDVDADRYSDLANVLVDITELRDTYISLRQYASSQTQLQDLNQEITALNQTIANISNEMATIQFIPATGAGKRRKSKKSK